MTNVTRREFAALAATAALAPPAFAQTPALLARPIPASGELLPAVGLGTAQVFDLNDETIRQKASAVLQALVAGGGRLVDTASVYGDAETVLAEFAKAGVDIAALAARLQTEGAQSFTQSWAELLNVIAARSKQLHPAAV